MITIEVKTVKDMTDITGLFDPYSERTRRTFEELTKKGQTVVKRKRGGSVRLIYKRKEDL